ncbi:MAG TPA: lytic transglycosylase domain-containing protein [Pyrinomonadaceae bacterium]|nr:lytic transglycosylase domain-containing protein [Pyrinomonadaceae bacterium]
MKKFPLFALILLAFSLPVAAQSEASSSNYRLDNFDFNLVRIQTPPAQVVPVGRAGKGKILTSNNFKYSHSSVPLIRHTSMSVSNSLAGFTTGNSNVDSLIIESGRRNSVDPLLLYAIMHQESTFKARALSNKGASGLMQLMPGTAARFGVKNIWDPKQNIEGGTRYMRFLLDKFEGNVQLALAGYNAGEGAVMKYGYNIPPYNETREYVRRISKRYSLIRDPLAARYANSVTSDQVAAAQHQESKPLTMYERSVFAVQLPDGRLQLISQ